MRLLLGLPHALRVGVRGGRDRWRRLAHMILRRATRARNLADPFHGPDMRASYAAALFAVFLPCVPAQTLAQAPTLPPVTDSTPPSTARPLAMSIVVDAARIAALDSVLPVRDDAGTIITEDEIKAAMKKSGSTATLMTMLGAGLGAILFDGLLPNPKDGADCSIYEPCTDREEMYKDLGPWAGAIIGGLFMAIVPDWERDRYEAVALIRRQRRAFPGTP
jgi:hypothetical protein